MRLCAYCDQPMSEGRYKHSERKKFCSKRCRLAARSHANKAERFCAECGKNLDREQRTDANYCSVNCQVNAWRNRNLGQTRERGRVYRMRRRALEAGSALETIDRLALFERDGGRCYLCGELCSRDAFELDHVIPLSAGGPTIPSNLRVTHIRCNRRKGVRLLSS